MRSQRLSGFMIVLLVVCNAVSAAQETEPASPEYWVVIDDFEDQNLDDWELPAGPCNAEVVDFGAAGTDHCMAVNGACGFYLGPSHPVYKPQPSELEVWVRASAPSGINHLFVALDDDSLVATGYIVVFYAAADGWFSLWGGPNHRYNLVPIDLEWHQVRFTFDWIGRHFDVNVDGWDYQNNVPFYTPEIGGIEQIHVFNVDTASAWYDQFGVEMPTESDEILVDGFESCDDSGWTTSSPELPKRLVLFAVDAPSQWWVPGRSGADVLCGQGARNRPGVPKHATTRAFISVTDSDSIANMPANYGVPTDRPVTGPNNIQIASDWADVLDSSIDVRLEAAGVTTTRWFSGSLPDGTLASDHCNGWTSGTGSGEVGRTGHHSATESTWINYGNASCGNDAYKILCLAWR